MVPFFNGISAAAAFVAGLLFLRYWRDSRQRVFLFFALAFWVLAADWAALTSLQVPDDSRHLIYVPRVAAFLLIFFAVLDKNRSARRR